MKRKLNFMFFILLLFIFNCSPSYASFGSSIGVKDTPNISIDGILKGEITPIFIICDEFTGDKKDFILKLQNSRWLEDYHFKNSTFEKEMSSLTEGLTVKKINDTTVSCSVYGMEDGGEIKIPCFSKPMSNRDLTLSIKGFRPDLENEKFIYAYVEDPFVDIEFGGRSNFKNAETNNIASLYFMSNVYGSFPKDKGMIQLKLGPGFQWIDKGNVRLDGLKDTNYTISKENEKLILNIDFSKSSYKKRWASIKWNNLEIKALEGTPNKDVHMYVTGDFIEDKDFFVGKYTKDSSSVIKSDNKKESNNTNTSKNPSIKDNVENNSEIEKPIILDKNIWKDKTIVFKIKNRDLSNTKSYIKSKEENITITVSKDSIHSLKNIKEDLKVRLYHYNPIPLLKKCIKDGSFPGIQSRAIKIKSSEKVDKVQITHPILNQDLKNITNVFVKESNDLHYIPSKIINGKICFEAIPNKEYIILIKKVSSSKIKKYQPIEDRDTNDYSYKDSMETIREDNTKKLVSNFTGEIYSKHWIPFWITDKQLNREENHICIQVDNMEINLTKNIINKFKNTGKDLDFILYRFDPSLLIKDIKDKTVFTPLSRGITIFNKDNIEKLEIGHPINVTDKNTINVFVKGSDNQLHFVPAKIVNGQIYFQLDAQQSYIILQRKINFNDINQHWSKFQIENLSSKGIISGFEDKTFRPEDTLTRAQTATILVKALGLDTFDNGNTKVFDDVDPNSWYGKYIYLAHKNNLISGIGHNKFDPNGPITGEQLIQLLMNAYELHKGTIQITSEDIKNIEESSAWAKISIAKAKKVGMLKEMPDKLRYTQSAKRSQTAALVFELLESIVSVESITS